MQETRSLMLINQISPRKGAQADQSDEPEDKTSSKVQTGPTTPYEIVVLKRSADHSDDDPQSVREKISKK